MRVSFRAKFALQKCMQGELRPKTVPHILLTMNVARKTDVFMGSLKFSEATFNLHFNNRVDTTQEADDVNSQLIINNLSANIDQNPFRANFTVTNFDKLLVDLKAEISLTVKDTADVLHATVALMSPEYYTYFKQLNIDKPVAVKLRIFGIADKNTPLPKIDVSFDLQHSIITFQTNVLSVDNLKGSFSNVFDNEKPSGNSNSQLNIWQFSGNWKNVNFDMYAKLSDFDALHLDCQLNLDAPLTSINQLMPVKDWQFRKGKTNLRATYEGSLREFTDKNPAKIPSKITGNFQIQQAELYFPAQQRVVSQLNAYVVLNDKSLIINNLQGKFAGQDFTVTGSIVEWLPYLFNAHDQDALLDITAKGNISFQNLNEWIKSAKYRFNAGEAALQMHYKGGIKEAERIFRTGKKDSFSGSILVKNASFDFLPEDYHYHNINAEVWFDESALTIKKFAATFNDNNVQVLGDVKNLIPFMLDSKETLVATLQLYSPWLVLDKILKPKNEVIPQTLFLQTDKNPLLSTQLFINERTPAMVLDEVTDKIESSIDLNVQKLSYRKFTAGNVSGKIFVKHNFISGENIFLRAADGYFQLDGYAETDAIKEDKIVAFVKLGDVSVDKVFADFENFGQQAILEKNLQGKMSADVEFQALLDRNLKIIPESMRGKLYIKIENGQLLDFEPLQKISKFVFKHRDFKQIQFAVIENSFLLNGTELRIKKMSVASNILNFLVEGIHNFTGNTDLSIQIPLKNFKKQEANFIPENLWDDEKLGMSIFLRANTHNGRMQIGYDPLKKLRAKKELKRKNKLFKEKLLKLR
ncbi:MAG: hypothetical protein H7Y04_04465 [Verrucomicrobia bacterium]|nr:hypothetical protein [Cytophagales bacterium]